MPTISRFHGITIQIYWKDHPLPHFHAIAAGRKAKIRIDNQEVLEGRLSRRQIKMVRRWGAVHRMELEENWHRAQDHEKLEPIEPWD